MAEAETKTVTKRKKPQGPRTVKPFHLLIRVNGDDGQPLQLNKSQVTIEVVKDPAVLLEMLTGGEGMNGAVYKQFTPPVESKAPAAA